MMKSFTIAKLCIRLLLRKGSIWGLSLGLVGLTALCFTSAKADGSITQELQIRTLYAYGIGYTFVNLAVIALACFTVRNQLDIRNIHQLSALPIQRSAIWLGQSMALFSFAVLLLVLLFSTLFTCSWFYQKSFPDADQAFAKEYFAQPTRVVKPEFLSDYDLIVKRVNESGGQLMANMPEEVWNAIHLQILTKEQRIDPNESKIYEIKLDEQPQSKICQFYFRPQLSVGRKIPFKVEILSDKKATPSHVVESSTMTLQKTYLDFPSNIIPADGHFFIRLTNKFSKSIAISRSSGVHCIYKDSSMLVNLIKALASQFIHLYISTILGMACGTALTFAVATFSSLVIFCLSISQGFFESIIQDLMFAYDPPFSQILMARLIEACLWITKGLRPPEVIEAIAQNNLIESQTLFIHWLPSTLIYGILLFILGAWILTKKELSKLEI